ncbi:hypothetical protein TIFTF001_011714 [Ficus carica]|uniref:Uncharacterized protein n=1 Tax=Ficus carica TaxID=3494 RepID=A0AA88AB07_FICCA|nr:hypothetical protein TIFTF001_011714 [Ficus carica]
MGNLFNKEPPPPMVLVPPLFDFPPLAARSRMLESSYNFLFGKLALKCLFEDYFEEAQHFRTMIMLKPIDDPHVDLVATVSGPLDHRPEENIVGKAFFRWQSDVDDPHTFVDLYVSSSDPILQMRSCAFNPKHGIGAFGVFPVLQRKRVGRLTAGLQYEPEHGSKDGAEYTNLKNWSGAIGYCVGSGSPLRPSFNFCLELAKSSQFNASFYQHVVVQRRGSSVFLYSLTFKHMAPYQLCTVSSKQVKNPLEENEIVGITNYIDFGFELQTRVDDAKASNKIPDSTFQVAASWQANKNFLLKGKVGSVSSAVALAFKSWWNPSLTYSISATRDHTSRTTGYGFGLRVENIREARYQRADPNYVMLTPNKEHLAEGIVWEVGKRPLLESDVNAGNFESIPRELRPLERIL